MKKLFYLYLLVLVVLAILGCSGYEPPTTQP